MPDPIPSSLPAPRRAPARLDRTGTGFVLTLDRGRADPERIPMTPHDILWLAEDVAAAMRSLVLAVG